MKKNISKNNTHSGHAIYQEISKKYLLCKKAFNLNEKSSIFFDLSSKKNLVKPEWIASRSALLILVDYFLSIKDLKGTLSLSISHTKYNAVVAGVINDDIDGIGVDIEDCSRRITNNVIKRISNPSEINISNNHQVWNIKEAVFKNCSFKNQKSIADVSIKKKIRESLFIATHENEEFLVKVFKFENVYFAISTKQAFNTCT